MHCTGGQKVDEPYDSDLFMMTESLVVIRTFGNLIAADEAQIELLSAGIYSLLLRDESAPLQAANIAAFDASALAVHLRDADEADAVLTPHPIPFSR